MLRHVEFDTEQEEYEWITKTISELIGHGFLPKDIAILARTNRICQIYLRQLGEFVKQNSRYNFSVKTHEPQMQKKAREILSLWGTWHAVTKEFHNGDKASLADIIHKTFCENLQIDLSEIDSAVSSVAFPYVPAEELSYLCKHIDRVLYERLLLFQSAYKMGIEGIGLLIKKMDDLGITDSLLGENPRIFVNEIYKITERYRELVKDGSLHDFLDWLDNIDNENAITVSTAHRSKGHEFKVVFMVGCVDNLWPHYYAVKAGVQSALDDEMRLFYVGCTRAEEMLFLTSYRKDQHGMHKENSIYIDTLCQLGCFQNPASALEKTV